jgi:hypothetical protein
METTVKHNRTFTNTVSLAEYCLTNQVGNLYIRRNRTTGGRVVRSETKRGFYINISTKVETLEDPNLVVSQATDVDARGNIISTFPLIHKLNKKYHKNVFGSELVVTQGSKIIIAKFAGGTSKVDELDNEIHALKCKIHGLALKVYAEFEDMPVLWNYSAPINGTKFILQQKEVSGKVEYRLRFDPYQFVENEHVSLSLLFDIDGWRTISGGWLRTTCSDENELVVVLYSSSGNYGPYLDEIAIPAAEKVFQYQGLLSYSNMEWNEIWNSNSTDDELPF